MTSVETTILIILAVIVMFLVVALLRLISHNVLDSAFEPVTFITYPTDSPLPNSSQPNYQIINCNRVNTKDWIDQTIPRLNAIDTDLEILNAYPPSSFHEYATYAASAKQRYFAQLSQNTPSCLTNVQELAVEELRLFWKGLEAASNGDGAGLNSYFSRLVEISGQADEMIQEIDLNVMPELTPLCVYTCETTLTYNLV